MTKNIIHNIMVCLVTFMVPMVTGCVDIVDTLSDEPREATLHLRISTIQQTRTYGVENLQPNEAMQSLRIVVLHQDGTIEHNIPYSLTGPMMEQEVTLKVRANETKKIFLFANEESITEVQGVSFDGEDKSLTSFFNRFAENDPGFGNEIDKIYFTPDYSDSSKAIPMSSMYKETIGETDISKTMYVVRIATKFTLNFKNWRDDDNLTVDSFSLSSFSDKNYLMAKVEDTQNNNELFGDRTWLEWMADVAEKSSEDSSGFSYGWLKDYDMPADTRTNITFMWEQPIILPPPHIDTEDASKSTPGMTDNPTVFYLPESKNLKKSSTDGEQEYFFTLKLSGNTEPLVCKLPNLQALFRNTNVVINVTINKDLALELEVIPFSEVILTPDFGLQRDDFTGYIVGKDKSLRPCWYESNYYDSEKAVPLYLGPSDHPGEFVTIDGEEYLLVYTDYERTPAGLYYIYEKDHTKHLLDPEGRTGYKTIDNEWGVNIYINKLQQRVWLDDGYIDPAAYAVLEEIGLPYKCCRILYEWDRNDWNKARWDKISGVYPKFWYDVLGNRYTWEEGATESDREKILKGWVKYLK